MAMHPKVLILDEPTAQLDPAARKDFLVMLQKLHKEFGLTIILTSHNLEDVMEMSDECVILDDGKLSNREIRKRLQDIFKNTSSIGTVSATDSSARREISDRTDLFDGRSKRTDQKKRISVNKENTF